LKGPLFGKDSDYAAIVADHHQAKIPRFLSSSEAQDQKDEEARAWERILQQYQGDAAQSGAP